MNFYFLAKLAKTNPALARLCEAMICSGICYVLGAIITWNAFSVQALFGAIATPAYLYFNKLKRDFDRDDLSGNMPKQ